MHIAAYRIFAAILILVAVTFPAFTSADPIRAQEQVQRAHPGWLELVRSAEFRNWLQRQPVELARLASSDLPEDAIRLIDRYKAEEQVQRAHPGWLELVRSAEFRNWLQRQPTEFSRLATSELPEDAIRLIDRYKEQLPTNTPPREAVPQTTTPNISAAKASPVTAPLSPKQIYSRAAPSVTRIIARSSKNENQGSAVILGPLPDLSTILREGRPERQLLATNRHVVGSADDVTVVHNGKNHNGSVVFRSAQTDIALISVAGVKSDWQAIEIADTDSIQIGSPTYAIGSPLGLDNSLSAGLVSGLREMDGVRLVQTTAPISPGSSGGGLFDENGRLIGVTTFRLRGGENINFAVRADTLLHMRRALHASNALSILPFGENDEDLKRVRRLLQKSDQFNTISWLWRMPSASAKDERAYSDVYRAIEAWRLGGYPSARKQFLQVIIRMEAAITRGWISED